HLKAPISAGPASQMSRDLFEISSMDPSPHPLCSWTIMIALQSTIPTPRILRIGHVLRAINFPPQRRKARLGNPVRALAIRSNDATGSKETQSQRKRLSGGGL